MAILAYDDVMLREPRLLVPGMQPRGRVKINPAVFPGKAQAFCPWLRYMGTVGVGEGTAVTLNNANAPFTLRLGDNVAHVYRLNTSTESGESYIWSCPDYNCGNAISMVFYGFPVISNEYGGGILAYGGTSSGAIISLVNDTSVKAEYVDSPTTSAYAATITGLTKVFTAKTLVSVGLRVSGNTVTCFCQGKTASTSGGNGGIRRASPSGLGSEVYIPNFYVGLLLGAATSVALPDAQMHAILADPFSIFVPA